MNAETPPPSAANLEPKPIRIWAVHMPFKKNGFPVVGTFGSREVAVVIMRMSDWTAMCNEIEALKTRQFEVGHYDE